MHYFAFNLTNGIHKFGLKSSYADVVSAVEDFLDQWHPSTAILMEEILGLQGGLC